MVEVLEPAPAALDLLDEQVEALGRPVRSTRFVVGEDLGSPPGQGVAERTDLGRESLYKTLSGGGNPKLATLRAVLEAMGLKLTIQPKQAA